jgi:hypothetical protein
LNELLEGVDLDAEEVRIILDGTDPGEGYTAVCG